MKRIVIINRIFGLMVFALTGALTLSFSAKMQASLDDLPREIQGEIVVALAQSRSSTIDEATKSIRALATTNKKFNELINKPEMTQVLLTILADRFTGRDKFEAAFALGTKGAKNYLDQRFFKKDIKQWREIPNLGKLWWKLVGDRNFCMMNYLIKKIDVFDLIIATLYDEFENHKTREYFSPGSKYRFVGLYDIDMVDWLSKKIEIDNYRRQKYADTFSSLLWNALQLPSYYEDYALKIIDSLLQAGFPANGYYHGSSLLAEAVKSGRIARVQLLLDYGARNKDALLYAKTPAMRKILKDVVLYMD